jgi:hypothetical protein
MSAASATSIAFVAAASKAAKSGSDDDINLSVLDLYLERPQTDILVSGVAPVTDIVFVPVPRTDDMDVGFREFQAVSRLFGLMNDFFDTIDDFALARRSALVNAIVLIGIEFPIDMKHTDLEGSLRDDFAITVPEFLGLSDVQIRHLCSSSLTC